MVDDDCFRLSCCSPCCEFCDCGWFPLELSLKETMLVGGRCCCLSKYKSDVPNWKEFDFWWRLPPPRFVVSAAPDADADADADAVVAAPILFACFLVVSASNWLFAAWMAATISIFLTKTLSRSLTLNIYLIHGCGCKSTKASTTIILLSHRKPGRDEAALLSVSTISHLFFFSG